MTISADEETWISPSQNQQWILTYVIALFLSRIRHSKAMVKESVVDNGDCMADSVNKETSGGNHTHSERQIEPRCNF